MRGGLLAGGFLVLAVHFGSANGQETLQVAAASGTGSAVPGGAYSNDPFELERAARDGDAQAQFRLGMRHLQGDGVTADVNTAVRWLRASADSGLARSAYQLGTMYRDGHGVVRDAKLAESWFRTAAASGHTGAWRALAALASAQASGEFTGVRAEAFRGDAQAQYELARWYQAGREPVSADPAEAVKWFRKAAEQDNAEAAYELGIAYLDGNGMARDSASARIWLDRAAARGLLRARVALRDMEREAESAAIDPIAALRSAESVPFYQAATAGDANAQYELGLMFFSGEGVARDYKQALYWLRRAAEQQNVNAQLFLAERYARGTEFAGDFAEAAGWYARAARLGSAEAQYKLGNLYQNGLGVKQSAEAARHWYTEAARQGHERARRQLADATVSSR
jgi:hypothetical protein